MYRFEHRATWHQAITSEDNQEKRDAVKGVEFRCFEQNGKVRSATTLMSGVSGKSTSLTLQTDDFNVGESIKANDYIDYNGFKYQVATVASIRSVAYKGAKEYLIGLI